MAELVPAPFADLVARLHREPRTQDALFELPRRKWWLPEPPTDGRADPDAADLSVRFHDRRAGNPAGPAAGPHTQMAQNLLLSYAAGGRILELKTVQVLDRLEIGRPCIDVANVGYNIEWSQELTVAQSLREYVAGAMLIAMFRRNRELSGGRLDGPAGDVIYDISVGYDLKGIQSAKVRGFLAGMRDAGAEIDRLRSEIPRELGGVREAEYDPRLSDSVTLSTFHGCPAGEIERIGEFLVGELDFDLVVKMNPPTLGREPLEHLLYDVLGYRELRVNPEAYAAAISLSDAVGLCQRLTDFAARRGRRVGFKFSNTLEVVNHRDFFDPQHQIMYLSGQPLHVITLALAAAFRRAVGPAVPISFSAGIDRHNFPLAVACGFVPVTVSTDLLRPGGYGRLGGYLAALAADMRRLGARTIDEYVVRWGEHAGAPEAAGPGSAASPFDARRLDPAASGLRNTLRVAELARSDPRYRAEANRKSPKRIDSHLALFDCVTCDKCLPVCPNAANFTYPTPIVAFDYRDVIVAPDGTCRPADEPRRFEIARPRQIACYADFCNECGNCDTFCPEYGGPYIEKPSIFGSRASWERAAPRDGFFVSRAGGVQQIVARMQGRVYELRLADGRSHFCDASAGITLTFGPDGRWPQVATRTPRAAGPAGGGARGSGGPAGNARVPVRVDLWAYHTLRRLLAGLLSDERIHQANVAGADRAGDRPAAAE